MGAFNKLYLNSYLIVAFLLLSNLSYAGGKEVIYTIAQLKEMKPDSSKLVDYNYFFHVTMRDPNKKYGSPLTILFETDRYVYFGVLTHEFGSQKEIVSSYYITDKELLETHFPHYKSGEAYKIRYIPEVNRSPSLEVKHKAGRPLQLNYVAKRYELDGEYIKIAAIYQAKGSSGKKAGRTVLVNTYFDKNTLQLVKSTETTR